VTARILAIDTTSEHGSLALAEDGVVVEEMQLHSPDGFGHVLFPELDTLLKRHAWRLADVQCFAAAAGPGSFTGIRVGLAAIKGLAQAMGRPAAAVSNLQALACYGSASMRAVVIDARRGEIYGAVYSQSLERVSPEVVMPPAVWLERLPECSLEFVSADFTCLEAAIASSRFSRSPRTIAPPALAGAVGRIANARLASGAVEQPAGVEANYVRRSDAEIFWKDR